MRSTNSDCEKPRVLQALYEIQQECGKAFLSTHTPQQQHDPMLANNLAAHDLVHMVL